MCQSPYLDEGPDMTTEAERIDQKAREALPPLMGIVMRLVRLDDDVMRAKTGVSYVSMRSYATGNKYPTQARLDKLLEWLATVGVDVDLERQTLAIDLKKYRRAIATQRAKS
jgi:hypothetical protein